MDNFNEAALDLSAKLLAELDEDQTEENVEQLIANHGDKDWDAAAHGDVAALIAIRTGCGLPVFR